MAQKERASSALLTEVHKKLRARTTTQVGLRARVAIATPPFSARPALMGDET
jgi:hypothetical protein